MSATLSSLVEIFATDISYPIKDIAQDISKRRPGLS
jgi:hypothetical protein